MTDGKLIGPSLRHLDHGKHRPLSKGETCSMLDCAIRSHVPSSFAAKSVGQKVRQLARRSGRAEEVALHLSAPFQTELVELSPVLDALGRRRHAKAGTKA